MDGTVSLSASQRQNLLTLQNTQRSAELTQRRLASGKKISSAVDGAVAFFSSAALNSRSSDFLRIKDNIDIGVGVLRTAITALESAEKLCAQMKGVALSAKATESRAERQVLGEQFNDLRDQLDALIQDAQFQGQNLIGTPPTDLTIRLNEAGAATASELTVAGKATSSSVLGITEVGDASGSITAVSDANWTDPTWKATYMTWVRLGGTNAQLEQLHSVVFTPPAGTDLTNVNLALGDPPANYWAGFLNIGSDNTVYSDEFSNLAINAFAVDLLPFIESQPGGTLEVDMNGDNVKDANPSVGSGWSVTVNLNTVTGRYWAGSDYLTQIDASLDELDTAIETIRTDSAKLGSNLSLLQIRNGFTKEYVDTLKEAEGKLTNADLNEEGANLVSIQTRAQLGVQALSFAGRQAEGLLSLFR